MIENENSPRFGVLSLHTGIGFKTYGEKNAVLFSIQTPSFPALILFWIFGGFFSRV